MRHECAVFRRGCVLLVAPQALTERQIDFFEAAIRDILDRCGDTRRKRGGKGVEVVPLEPAERGGEDHFVEGKLIEGERVTIDCG